MAGEVNLQVTLIQNVVTANMQGPQKTYALIEARPMGAQISAVQMPLNLSLVLDRSGSMKGQKIDSLRQAVHMLIDQLQPNDFISIVLFDDKVDVPLASMPAQNKQQLHDIANGIVERGGTQMSLGLQKGLEETHRNYNPNDPNRIHKILLLTDGMSWGDDAQILQCAQQAGQSRIPIVALGLGLPGQNASAQGVVQGIGGGGDWNDVLLDQIAQASGGKSDLITAPQDIVKVFQSEVRSAQGSVVRNAQMLLRLSADVSATQVWQVVPLIQSLGGRAITPREVQVTLGDIDKNTGQQILVELVLPSKPPCRMRAAQAEVSYDVPLANVFGEKVRVDMIVEYGTASTPNPQVANLVERVVAHNLQTRALQSAQSGNTGAATQMLQAAATRLVNLGETDQANLATQEAQNLQQQGQMSSSGTKRLKYETRRFTQQLDPSSGNPTAPASQKTP
ncbi:MAG: VWA domain-containing protein [Anaerolineae bacterium]